MKKVTTLSFSTPTNLVIKVDEIAEKLNISRSAVLTAMISFALNWNEKDGETNDLETLLKR